MTEEIQEGQDNSYLYILLGAILGAITGAGAGYVLSKRIQEGDQIQLTAGDGIKVGTSLIALFRQISNLGQ